MQGLNTPYEISKMLRMTSLQSLVRLQHQRLLTPSLDKAAFVLWHLREVLHQYTGHNARDPREVLADVKKFVDERELKNYINSGDLDAVITIAMAFAGLEVALSAEATDRSRRAIEKRLGDDPSSVLTCTVALKRLIDPGWHSVKDVRTGDAVLRFAEPTPTID